MRKVLLGMCFLLLASCEKHIEVEDIYTKYKIGNILCSDGSITHPSIIENKTPIAVIFYCGSSREEETENVAYAIGLSDLGEACLTEKLENISEVSEDIYAFDGFKNTSSFKLDAEKDTIRQPAIDLVWEYEAGGLRGWYIGSVAQHEALYENLDIVNETFSKIGVSTLSGLYWTSTEDVDSPNYHALVFSYSDGESIASRKDKNNNVRPFITLK